MASPAQIGANRANAQLSTGPRTPAGIAACRHNATKHGLTGKQIVIPDENPAEYDALRAALIAQYDPATEVQAMLVEQIAQSWWRLQRARRVEAELLNQLEPEKSSPSVYQNLIRMMNAIERSWNRARTDLEKLQKAAEPEPRAEKIGFVLSTAVAPPPQPRPVMPELPGSGNHPMPVPAEAPPTGVDSLAASKASGTESYN